jgi:hypothetical protein
VTPRDPRRKQPLDDMDRRDHLAQLLRMLDRQTAESVNCGHKVISHDALCLC